MHVVVIMAGWDEKKKKRDDIDISGSKVFAWVQRSKWQKKKTKMLVAINGKGY